MAPRQRLGNCLANVHNGRLSQHGLNKSCGNFHYDALNEGQEIVLLGKVLNNNPLLRSCKHKFYSSNHRIQFFLDSFECWLPNTQYLLLISAISDNGFIQRDHKMPGSILNTTFVNSPCSVSGLQYFSQLELYQTQFRQEGCYLP